MGGILSFLFAQEPHPIEAADIQETEDSSSAENSPASPVTEVDSVPFNQSGNITQRTETSPPFPVTSDHTDEAERKNIYVLCSGKSQEFFMYPLEKISVLLQEACVWAKKKPEKMNLVFEGECLDALKKMIEYPGLRSGSRVNLIHAC